MIFSAKKLLTRLPLLEDCVKEDLYIHDLLLLRCARSITLFSQASSARLKVLCEHLTGLSLGFLGKLYREYLLSSCSSK